MHSTDNVQIDTPEQITLELPLAGIGSRFLALAFDTLLQFAIAMLGIILLFVVPAQLIARLLSSVLPLRFLKMISPVVAILFFFCLYWGYFAFFEIIWKGQTPGKRHAGIRVLKETGRPINTYEAIGRNLMRAVDGFPLYGIGIVCMMLNKQNRRLGDYVAGTVVVHEKGIEEFRPDLTRDAERPAPTRVETANISADELVLVESYLQRRFELDPAVRAASAQRIVTLVANKAGLKPETGQSDDDFLESVVRAVRDGARFRM